jgi:hypothetical protein
MNSENHFLYPKVETASGKWSWQRLERKNIGCLTKEQAQRRIFIGEQKAKAAPGPASPLIAPAFPEILRGILCLPQ